MQTNSTSPQSSQNSRKPHRNITSTGRPRGRPPNVNKYLQPIQQGSNLMSHFGSKSNYTNYINTSGTNRSMMNPYYMNPLVDPTVLSALLASNIIDPLSAMSYFNQMGSYQDILRHYQSNLSSLTNLTGGLNNPGTTITGISNVSTMITTSSSINTTSITTNISNLSNLNNMTVQQLLNMNNTTASTARTTPMYHQTTTKTSTTMSMTKDRPSISITPVTTSLTQQPHKTKPSSKQPSTQSDPLPVHIPKSLQISPTKPVLHSPTTTQVSLLKPSVIQQVKTSPPKQVSAPQIRVSKSLIEPQPAHNSSLSHSPLKNSSGSGGVTNPAAVPQVAHTSGAMGAPVVMKSQGLPMNLPTSRSGTSLQHKLLSKKNSQRQYPQTNMQNLIRKTKAASKAMPVLPGSFPNLLNTMPSGSSAISQSPFITPELSGISVSAVTQPPGMKTTKYHGYKKSNVKPKATVPTTAATTSVDVPSSLPASFSQGGSVEALSMLSQLQQHAHLEIIPQQKAPLKSSIDYSKVTMLPQKVPSDTLRSSTAECMPMYDMPRGKPPTNISTKKADKLANDSVEIITLDD